MSKLLKLHRDAVKSMTPSTESLNVDTEALTVSTEEVTFWGCFWSFFFFNVVGLVVYITYQHLKDRAELAKKAVVGKITNKSVLAIYSESGKVVHTPEASFAKASSQILAYAKDFETACSVFFDHRVAAYKTLAASLKKGDHEETGKLVNKLASEANSKLPSTVMAKWIGSEFLGGVTLVKKDKEGVIFEYEKESNAAEGELKNLTGDEIVGISKAQANLAKELDTSVKTFHAKMEHFKEAPAPDMALLGIGITAGGDHAVLEALFGNARNLRSHLAGFNGLSRYVDELNHATDLYVKLSVK